MRTQRLRHVVVARTVERARHEDRLVDARFIHRGDQALVGESRRLVRIGRGKRGGARVPDIDLWIDNVQERLLLFYPRTTLLRSTPSAEMAISISSPSTRLRGNSSVPSQTTSPGCSVL